MLWNPSSIFSMHDVLLYLRMSRTNGNKVFLQKTTFESRISVMLENNLSVSISFRRALDCRSLRQARNNWNLWSCRGSFTLAIRTTYVGDYFEGFYVSHFGFYELPESRLLLLLLLAQICNRIIYLRDRAEKRLANGKSKGYFNTAIQRGRKLILQQWDVPRLQT